MAITIDLPELAEKHARECATTVGQASLEAWILEWLTNTVKGIEKQRRQVDVNKLATRIDSQIDALYDTGDVSVTPVITVPK